MLQQGAQAVPGLQMDAIVGLVAVGDLSELLDLVLDDWCSVLART